MAKQCILILGGARSGKSRLATKMAQRLGQKVLFVATAEARDEEMRQKIEKHKRERPSDWRCIEVPMGVGKRIRAGIGAAQVVIVDCLTLLVSNLIDQCCDDQEQVNVELVQEKLVTEVNELLKCIDDSAPIFILVSNEVGLGVVPGTRLGRLYRDLLGEANKTFVEHADEVYFMFSGIPLKLKKET